MEHEAVPEPPRPQPTQEELDRQAIADQPTELFDVEGEFAAAQEAPSEEDLFEAEAGEPRLDSAEPVEEEIDLDDDFFDEQSLSAELDQALDAPPGRRRLRPLSPSLPSQRRLGRSRPRRPEPEAEAEAAPAPEPSEEAEAPEPEAGACFRAPSRNPSRRRPPRRRLLRPGG